MKMKLAGFIFVIICTFVLSSRKAEAADLVFGMSAPLNTTVTPAASLGLLMYSGIKLAFDETNAKFGGLNGNQLSVIPLDDSYLVANTRTNVENLITGANAFAIVGVIGADQSEGASEVCETYNVPFIGPYTGDYRLYNPFNKIFVNVRASYADEVNTILSFLSNDLRLTKVSAFYQNESIQVAGFDNLTLAFNLLGLKLVSQGVYDKNDPVNSTYIMPAVLDIFAGGTAQPEAIACIGTFAQIVTFIVIWRQLYNLYGCTYCLDTYFVMASFVGPELFSAFLQMNSIDPLRSDGTSAMYISQVVPFPNPQISKLSLVAEYYSTGSYYYALAGKTFSPSFTELEGYLVGRFIVDTLFRIRSNNPFTEPWASTPNFDTSTTANKQALRNLFLETVYNSTSTYNLGGIQLGPFSDVSGDQCSQGMREVFMVALAGNYSYYSVPSGDYSFPDVCGSKTSDVARPLAFGQSADLSGDSAVVANKVRAGIQAAFAGRNTREGGYNGRQLILITYDDNGDEATAISNVNTLVNENTVFGIMGSVGDQTVMAVTNLTASLDVPVIGPIAGATELRDPWKDNIINVRGSVADETTQLVNYMSTTLQKFRVIALHSDDLTGTSGLNALLNSLEFLGVSLIANASYDPATGNITAAYNWLNSVTTNRGQTPEAIYLYGSHTPLAKFIKVAHDRWPNAVFFATSAASPEGISAALVSEGVSSDVQLFMGSVVPYPWDTSYPIVQQYLSDMATASATADIGFSSLEGYIEATFATQVLDLLSSSSNKTGADFIDAIYERELFAFQGIRLGPFGNEQCTRNTLACKCNQGLHQVWMIKMNTSFSWEPLNDTLVWTDCQSTSTAIGVPLVFGQIMPYTSDPEVSYAITYGVRAAFGYLNDNPSTSNSQNVTLITLNSDSESVDSLLNDLLYSYNVFALVGLGPNAPSVAPRAAEYGVPSIGSVSSVSSLRSPYNRLYVNIRGSYADSAGAAISFLSSRGISTAAVVYEQSIGDDVVSGVDRAVANFSMSVSFASYDKSSYNLQDLVNGMGSNPAVLLFGPERICANFVKLAKDQKAESTIYMAVGLSDPDYFSELLVSTKKRAPMDNVYATSAVPPLSQTDNSIVSDYLRDIQYYYSAVTPTTAGLEGYIAGRLIGEVFKRDESISRDTFLQTLYNFAVFNISGLRVGPYGAECSDSTCYCNQGMRQVWVGEAGVSSETVNVPDSTYEFSGCGVSYPTDASSSGTNTGAIVGGVVGGVLGLLFLLAIVAAILFFLFFRNYRKRERELAYALQNTPLSMLENSLVEMEMEMAQMTPFDGENSILYPINDAMFPIHLDKTFLDFGIDSHNQCPINSVLTDTLVIENTGRDKVEYRFHHALRNHKMSLLFTPNRGSLKPGKTKEIKVELVMKITTTINEPVIIEAVDNGHVVLNVKKESELSTMLDYEEITINGPPIGVGGFGKVFRGHWRGAEVAVKVLRDQNPHIKELTQFKNEIEMVNKLRHKNIVNFIGAVTVPGKMCMVTEFIKLGSLQAAIHGHKKMTKLVKAKIALDVANGMNFLHQSGILHRDLKPDNVLLISLSGKADINAKLTDFGTSRAVGAGSEDFTFTKGLGTPIYMAPEILGHQDYSEKADVYSFAIMLWALVAGKEPYSDFKNSWDIARFVSAGKRLDVPKNAGALMNHLITSCWAHNQEERPSFDEIVQELQSYVNVKKYGGDDASGEPTEGDASSYGFGSRANESRGLSKNSGGKSSRNNTRNSRNTTRNTSSNGSGGPPSKNTSAFGFGAPSSRNTTKEGYSAGIPAPPAAGGDSSDDSSDESDVASDKGKSILKAKLKKAGKNVTWDENNSK